MTAVTAPVLCVCGGGSSGRCLFHEAPLTILVRVMDRVLLEDDGTAWILLSRLHRALLVELVASGYEARTAYERDVLS